MLNQLFKSTIESRELRRLISRALKANKLTFGELEILYLLRKTHTLQPKQIALELKQDNGTISRSLALLHYKNLVAYTIDCVDRRCVCVNITTYGVQLLNNFINTVYD